MSAVVEGTPARAAGRRWLGFALAFAALTIWSGWFAVTRLSLTRELGAYDIAALRLGVGALVLLPAFLRSAPISPADRHKIAHGNAERLLRL